MIRDTILGTIYRTIHCTIGDPIFATIRGHSHEPIYDTRFTSRGTICSSIPSKLE